ncbi:LysE family translocator [Desulfovibrio mangrovi]|uniref:LysE family translocator n=1 Tax=Desulfovibrio mangrovi TaxID=2976983 RepID=UPI002246A5E2|nr:LysE family translocator [Desulfovibrio mangrovi]UZP67154.1 LysE family translocator [Desulfovibrio mangrovi]
MIETILTLFTVCFFARMSPGPDMMLLIKHSTAAHGYSGEEEGGGSCRAAYACVLGVCVGLCFHVMLSVLGLAIIIKSNPMVFAALRYAGAVYLLYVGWRCFTDRDTVQLEGQGGLCTTAGQGFRDGLFCNLLNPKVTMFILSVFMQLVTPETSLFERLAYGAVIVLEGLFGWAVFVYFLHTPFMKRLYGNHAGIINKTTGVVLFALGGAIFVWG